jgi:hypothetical protein
MAIDVVRFFAITFGHCRRAFPVVADDERLQGLISMRILHWLWVLILLPIILVRQIRKDIIEVRPRAAAKWI